MAQPTPPTKASLQNGRLKDTAANRALSPEKTPQSIFAAPNLRKQAFFSDDTTLIFNGQVKDQLRLLIKSGLKVDCIVTSPPYYGQRDYGVSGQLGLEKHPSEYLQNLVEVFNLCGELLKDTGSLWVNIGDTYWSGKGAHKSSETKQGARRFGLRPQDRPGDGKWARPKQLLLVPHRMAVAMQDSGWLVRNDNVWVKPNPVPDQVRDRCSISHEYVFHFTKSRWYYFDRMAVGRKLASGVVLPPLDTWEVATASGSKSHKASFSSDLVKVPVLATTPAGGVVLDPFCGSGTTLAFAKSNGFRAIGIDLKKQYCEETRKLVTSIRA